MRLFSSLAVAISPCVVALVPTAVEADDKFEFAVENRGERLQPPAGSGTGTQLQGSFDVLAGDGDGTATLTLTHRLEGLIEGRTFRAQYRLSAPFDRDKTDQVDIGSLSKLVGGTTLGIEISYVDAPRNEEEERLKADAIRAKCDQLIGHLIPGYTEQLLAGAGYNKGCTIAGLRDFAALDTAAKKINKDREDCKKTPQKKYCQEILSVDRDAAITMDKEDWLETSSQVIEDVVDASVGPIGMFTFGASVNEKKFDYVLPEMPTEAQSDRENGWAASLVYTRVNVDTIWAVGYTHEESYKAGDKAEICVPFGTTGALSCNERSVGAPTRENKELFFAEYRRFVLSDDVAISPRVEFDADESEWALRVPVYLTGDKKGRLTAGIVFGWDEENDAGAGVFVAKPLGFLK